MDNVWDVCFLGGFWNFYSVCAIPLNLKGAEWRLLVFFSDDDDDNDDDDDDDDNNNNG